MTVFEAAEIVQKDEIKSIKKITLVAATFIVCLIFSVFPVMAAPPKLPSSFFGTVTLDGSPVADGIGYAAQIGAEVINLSLVATSASDTLGLAVADAWNAGAVVVAAAGNNDVKTLF